MTKDSFIKFVKSVCMSRFLIIDSVATWIAAQMALESNFGTSSLAVEANNICGMRYPILRYSLAVGQRNGFSVYKSWSQCIADYILRHNYFRITNRDISSIGYFKKFILRTGYCPERAYISRVDEIYNQINSQNNVTDKTKEKGLE